MPELNDIDCKKYFCEKMYSTNVGIIDRQALARMGPRWKLP